MNFIFEDYNTTEIKWKPLFTQICDVAKVGKWNYENQSCRENNVSDNRLQKSFLKFGFIIRRNNINSVLMFILMPTIIITVFNIVCYLLPVGG